MKIVVIIISVILVIWGVLTIADMLYWAAFK